MKSMLSVIVCVVASASSVHAQVKTADWQAVRNLRPGMEIVVTVRGSSAGTRYFVGADDSNLTVLNMTDPTLPRAATRLLIEIASLHPEYFVSNDQIGEFVNQNVRVTAAGVFVAGQQVASFGQVVHTIARNEVADIRTVSIHGSKVRAALWGVGGYFAGGMAGGAIGGAVGRGIGGAFIAVTVGAPVGIVLGAIHGYRKSIHKTEDVIYRAP